RYEFASQVWDTTGQEYVIGQRTELPAEVVAYVTMADGDVLLNAANFQVAVNHGPLANVSIPGGSSLETLQDDVNTALVAALGESPGVTAELVGPKLTFSTVDTGFETTLQIHVLDVSDPAQTQLGIQSAVDLGGVREVTERRYLFYRTRNVEGTEIDTRAGADVVHADPGFIFADDPTGSEWGIKLGAIEQRGLISELTIRGGDGPDILMGGAYDDVIEGGADDDIIFGYGGNDRIDGGSGNDLVAGNNIPPQPDAYEIVTRGVISGRNDTPGLAAKLGTVGAGSVVDDLSFHQGDPGDWYLIDTPASFLALGDTLDPHQSARLLQQMLDVEFEDVGAHDLFHSTGVRDHVLFVYPAEVNGSIVQPVERFIGVPDHYLVHVVNATAFRITAEISAPDDGRINEDATWNFVIDGGSPVEVTLPLTDTYDAQNPDNPNTSVAHLVSDIQIKIQGTELAGRVVVSADLDNRLRFTMTDNSTLELRVDESPSNAAFVQLGFVDGQVNGNPLPMGMYELQFSDQVGLTLELPPEAAAKTINPQIDGELPAAILVGDVNGDGFDDWISMVLDQAGSLQDVQTAANTGAPLMTVGDVIPASRATLQLGAKHGTPLPAAVQLVIPAPVLSQSIGLTQTHFAGGDFDGDGTDDLAMSFAWNERTTGENGIFGPPRGTGVYIVWGENGTDKWKPGETLDVMSEADVYIFGNGRVLTPGDFDADGSHDDLFVELDFEFKGFQRGLYMFKGQQRDKWPKTNLFRSGGELDGGEVLENEPGAFYGPLAGHDAGLWHVTGHRKTDLGHAGGGSYYYGQEDSLAYDAGMTAGWIVLPPLPVTEILNLGFNYFLDTDRGITTDNAQILISKDGGDFELVDRDTLLDPVVNQDFAIRAFNNTLDAPQSPVGELVDGSGRWRRALFDLSDAMGGINSYFQLAFSFDTDDDANNKYEGWYVDDIFVHRTDYWMDNQDVQVMYFQGGPIDFAPAGDADGAGGSDLIAVQPSSSYASVEKRDGYAFLYLGPTLPANELGADVVFTDSILGFINFNPVGVGDIDNDTYADFMFDGDIISFLVWGRSTADWNSLAIPLPIWTTPESNFIVGFQRFVGVGDVDNDGIDDLGAITWEIGPTLDERMNVAHEVGEVYLGNASREHVLAQVGLVPGVQRPDIAIEGAEPLYASFAASLTLLEVPPRSLTLIGVESDDTGTDGGLHQLVVAETSARQSRLYDTSLLHYAPPPLDEPETDHIVREYEFELATPLPPALGEATLPGLDLHAATPAIADAFGIVGSEHFDHLTGGLGVVDLGDINNDRAHDLLITDENQGYILLGPVDLHDLEDAADRAEIIVNTAELGTPFSRGGDINNDGTNDLIFVQIVPGGMLGPQLTVKVFFGDRRLPIVLDDAAIVPGAGLTLNATNVLDAHFDPAENFLSAHLLNFDGDEFDDLLVTNSMPEFFNQDLKQAVVLDGETLKDGLLQSSLSLQTQIADPDGIYQQAVGFPFPFGASYFHDLQATVLGDVNGDGREDMGFVMPRSGVPTNTPIALPDAGSSFVVLGRSPLPGPGVDLEDLSAQTYTGPSFGAGIFAMGDLDDDGYDDYAVGRSLEMDGGAAGTLLIFRGSGELVDFGQFPNTGTLASDKAMITVSAERSGGVGAGLGLLQSGGIFAQRGDFDGDGRPDVALGLPDTLTVRTPVDPDNLDVIDTEPRGSVAVYFDILSHGSVVTVDDAGLLLNGTRLADELGRLPLTPDMDVDGDRVDDLLIGARRLEDVSGAPVDESGQLYVVYGSRSAEGAPTGTNVYEIGNKSITGSGFFLEGKGQTFKLGELGEGFDLDGDGKNDLQLDPEHHEQFFRFTTLGDGRSGDTLWISPGVPGIAHLRPLAEGIQVDAANDVLTLEFDLLPYMQFATDSVDWADLTIQLQPSGNLFGVGNGQVEVTIVDDEPDGTVDGSDPYRSPVASHVVPGVAGTTTVTLGADVIGRYLRTGRSRLGVNLKFLGGSGGQLAGADLDPVLKVEVHDSGVLADLLDEGGTLLIESRPVISLQGQPAGTYYLRVHLPSDAVPLRRIDFDLEIFAPLPGWTDETETYPDRDLIRGADGDDVLFGNHGLDRIYGESGLDGFVAERIEVRDLATGEPITIPASDQLNGAALPPEIDPVVEIPDPYLKEVLAEKLDLPVTLSYLHEPLVRADIHASELAMVTVLDLAGVNVGSLDLTGLERAVNLTGLTLSGQNVDMATLVPSRTDKDEPIGLGRLENLSLDIGAAGGTLGYIRQFTAIERLSADHNVIHDLSPISGLTRIEMLSLDHAGLHTHQVSSHGLLGEYFQVGTDNLNLPDLTFSSFNSIYTRVDPDVDVADGWLDFNGLSGLFMEFAVRWSGGFYMPVSGDVTLFVESADSNDQSRLYIDDVLLIDNTAAEEAAAEMATVTLSEGWHALQLQFLESYGTAGVHLSYQLPGESKQIIPQSALSPSGLLAEYYVPGGPINDFPAFDTLDPIHSQIEPDIDHESTLAGFAGFPDLLDNFAGRWTGQVYIEIPGDVQFRIDGDFKDRLFINRVEVIPSTQDTVTVQLPAGWHELRYEFFEINNFAQAHLYYTPAGSMDEEIIPVSVLRPAADLNALRDLQTLEIVSLSNNRIEELKPLEGLDALRIVRADNNRIESLDGLTGYRILNDDDETGLEGPLQFGDSIYSESDPGWQSNINEFSGAFGGDYRFLLAEESTSASWRFTGLAQGSYDVQATWFAEPSNTAAAQFNVDDQFTVAVNQKFAAQADAAIGGRAWQTLATVDITDGDLSVVLDSGTDPTGQYQDSVVIADAVRVVRHSDRVLELVTLHGNPLEEQAHVVDLPLFFEAPAGGESLYFDGVNDVLTVPVPLDQDSRGGTFEAWVYPESVDGIGQLISTADDGSGWTLSRSGASWWITAGGFPYSTGLTVDANQWQHLAAVFDPDNGVTLYKNGVRSSYLPATVDSGVTTDTINIGARLHDPGPGDPSVFFNFFEGRIDEFRVWDRPLSEQVIRSRMTLPLVGDEGGLLGLYSFDEIVMTEVGREFITDDSRFQQDAELLDGLDRPHFPADGVAAPLRRDGGQSLRFDGIDDVVTTSLQLDQSFGPGGVTFEVWVRPAAGAAGPVISTDDGAGDLAWSLLAHDGTWQIESNSGLVDTGMSVDADTWQRLSVSFDSSLSLASFYKDGTLMGGYPPITNDNSTGSVQIGGSTVTGQYFAGDIDEVAIWNRPLHHEVRGHQTTRLTGDEDGLVGYYQFDGIHNSLEVDLAAPRHDGTTLGEPDLVDGAPVSVVSYHLNPSAPVLQAIGPQSASPVALDFDGIDDVVVLPAHVFDGLTSVTTEFRLKTTETLEDQAVFSVANSTHTNEYLIFINNDTDLELYLNHIKDAAWDISGLNIADNQWHHFAIVRDSATSQATLYVDGASQGSHSVDVSPLQAEAVVIGQDQDSVGGNFSTAQALHGSLTDVAVWAHARTSLQIAEDINHEFHMESSGLRAWWDFDARHGSQAFDQSSNRYHGQIIGDLSRSVGPQSTHSYVELIATEADGHPVEFTASSEDPLVETEIVGLRTLKITAPAFTGTTRIHVTATDMQPYVGNPLRRTDHAAFDFTRGGGAIYGTKFEVIGDSLLEEGNDTIGESVRLATFDPGSLTFFDTGYIGDNPFLSQPLRDVDLMELPLVAGDSVEIDVDAKTAGSDLNTVLRVFTSWGVEVFANDEGAAPGETATTDSYLAFTTAVDETFYIGVSSNSDYDPVVEGSGSFGTSTGSYEITIRINGGSNEVMRPLRQPLAGWPIYVDTNHNGQPDGQDPVTITDATGAYRLAVSSPAVDPGLTDLSAGAFRITEGGNPLWYRTNGPTTGGFDFQAFQNFNDLNFAGNASQADDVMGQNLVRLTTDDPNETGAVWYDRKLKLNQGFETAFTYQMGNFGMNNGAGFAFVVQSHDPQAIGEGGSGMGYDRIAKSVAIEFDTFLNPLQGDTDGQHVSIHTNGAGNNSAHESSSAGIESGVSELDELPHEVRIIYRASQIEIAIDAQLLITVPIDLSSVFDSEGRAWVGFTAATTGSESQRHDILDWKLVTGGDRVNVAADEILTDVNFVNRKLVDIGDDLRVAEGSVVSFAPRIPAGDGGSRLSIGRTFSYQWDVLSDNGQNVPSATTANFEFTPVQQGTYEVTLTVTDQNDPENPFVDRSFVFVDNVAPTVNLNQPEVIEIPESTLSLTAAVSDPGTLDDLTYSWVVTDMISGQSVDIPVDTPVDMPTFDFSTPDEGRYMVGLTVSDDDGGSRSEQFEVRVFNAAPVATMVITDGTADGVFLEGELVTLNAGTSIDGGLQDELSYAWEVFSPDNTLLGSSTQSVFSFIPPDEGVYDVWLMVTDDDEDSHTILQQVTVLNALPVPATISVTGDLAESEEITLAVSATDPGTEDILTFSWDVRDQDNTQIAFGPGVSDVGDPRRSTFPFTVPDDGLVTATVIVTDDDGGSASSSVVFSVSNVAPTINLNGPVSIHENGAYVLTLDAVVDPGEDTAAVLVDWGDSSPDEWFAAPIPLTAIHFYSVGNVARTITVDLQDEDGTYANAASLAISVTNVNDAPTDLVLNGTTVNENSPIGTQIGTFSVTDEDTGDVHTLTLVAGVGDTGNHLVEVDGGILKTAGNLDHETTDSFSIRVRVTDSDTASYEESFVISVNDVNEAATAILLTPSSVPENAEGAIIGALTVSDADAGDSHLLEVDAGDDRFEIVAGELKLRPGKSLDHEPDGSVSLRMTARDQGGLGLESTQIVTITIEDVNEPLVVSDDAFNLSGSAVNGQVVGTVAATDPDVGETFAFSITDGNESGLFEIDPLVGRITVADASPLEEATLTWSLTVLVEDSGGHQDTATITVSRTTQSPSMPLLWMSNVAVIESVGSVDVAVTLAGSVPGGFSVDYTLPGGTADGSDYTTTGGSLTFHGDTGQTQFIHVPISLDSMVEADEMFTVALSNVVPFAAEIDGTDIDASATGNVTIVNDDVAGLAVADVSVIESAGTVDVAVTLAGSVQGGFSVDYTLPGGTAGASDYTQVVGALVFVGTDGETQTISVPITLDGLVEADETFSVALSNVMPTAAGVDAADIDATATGTVTITDADDPPAHVSLLIRDSENDTFDSLDTLAVTFNEEVNVNATALSLLNDTLGGSPVDLTGILFNYHAASMTATWNFTGVAGIETAFYTVVLDATLITDNSGNPLDGDGDGTGGDDFDHALLVAARGDSDADGDVDLSDYNRLATNFDPFGTTLSWADGNFDDDGDIDLSDYNILTATFNPLGYARPVVASSAVAGEFEMEDQAARVLSVDVQPSAFSLTSPDRFMTNGPGATQRNAPRDTTTVYRSETPYAFATAFAQYEHDRRSLGTLAASDSNIESMDLSLEEFLETDEIEHLAELFREQD
ncbi:MAG: hypothetical protein CMJ81_17670, partial [Planctomycetaceae bacterium]|nr:hypothetical protein [Planctomycetaceae bacterium]